MGRTPDCTSPNHFKLKTSGELSLRGAAFVSVDNVGGFANYEFADQVAKSRWLRIRCVNRVFALTLTRFPSSHASFAGAEYISSDAMPAALSVQTFSTPKKRTQSASSAVLAISESIHPEEQLT